MTITRLNPDGMHVNPVFTQVITVQGASKLIFVGGQNGVTAAGKIIGEDIESQAEQTFKNLITALAAAGATLNDVVKMNVYIVQGQSLQAAFAAAQRVQTMPAQPPTISVLMVAGLANPQFLIEIEALAAVGSGG